MSLVIDTEAIRYKWRGAEGQFPDYQKVIPTEFNTVAHLDTVEAVEAVNSLKALLGNAKDYPIDLTIGEGKMTVANPDGKGEAMIPADVDGQGYVRVDGKYLAQALRACGGMVDFKLANAYSPMLFTADSYQVVVMPMMSNKAEEQAKQDGEAKETQVPVEPSEEAEAKAVAEAEAVIKEKGKPKRSRKREKVAVA